MTLYVENADPVPENPGVLTGWKRIAGHFGCNVRTVRRYEHERGLPVHRAPGRKGSAVFAYATELDAWLQSREIEHSPDISQFASDPVSSPGDGMQDNATLVDAISLSAIPSHEQRTRQIPILRWQSLVFAASALLIFSAAVFWKAENRQTDAASTVASSRNVPADAEQMFLRGRYYWSLRSANSLTKAIDAYTQAIMEDPLYAEAYAGLAEAYDLSPQFSSADPGASFAQAERAANKALQLDPNLASAHRAKAFALFYWNWDIAGSDAEFRRALALDPTSAQTHQWYASTLFGRFERTQCLRQIDEALRLDPTSAAIATDAAFMHASFGDNFAANMRRLAELEQTQPTLMTPSEFRKELAYISGEYPTYIAELRRKAFITRNPDDRALAEAAERGWIDGGKRGMLEELILVRKRAIAHDADMGRSTNAGFWVGRYYVALGEPAKALPYFRSLLDSRFIPLTPPDCGWATRLSHDPGYVSLYAQIRQRFSSRLTDSDIHPASCAILQ